MAYGPSELTAAMIALIDKRWAKVQDVQRLIEPLEIFDVVRKIHFFMEIKRVIRLTPLGAFSDEEQRQNLLSVCQEALDRAVDEEEDQWAPG
jgi:type III secretion protein W